jgi:lactate dehydrogenase-like 2-hydroxyacid dehydrogenase
MAHGLIGGNRKFSRSQIESAKNLQIISSISVGYDNYDVDALTEQGVLLTNTPDVLTETTADLAFALILSTARDLIEFDPLVFNRYGDGPLNTENSRELLYGKPEALDQTCFQAPRSLANHLEKEDRKFMVVSTPLNPDWKAKYDPHGAIMTEFSSELVVR